VNYTDCTAQQFFPAHSITTHNILTGTQQVMRRNYRRPEQPQDDRTMVGSGTSQELEPEMLSRRQIVPIALFVKYRIYRGKRRMRDRYREHDDSSQLLLLVRKVSEDLFHIRMFDPDYDDDPLSAIYYRDDEIEELVDDLCNGHSIDSLIGSSAAEYYVRGNTLNMIFDKYRMVRATEKQVEILEVTRRRAIVE
jgi:hypothetical protein